MNVHGLVIIQVMAYAVSLTEYTKEYSEFEDRDFEDDQAISMYTRARERPKNTSASMLCVHKGLYRCASMTSCPPMPM